MTRSRPVRAMGFLAGALTAGACLSVILLTWFGFQALGESRRSESQLAERQARETVDTVMIALTRDMSGVQQFALPALWDELVRDPSGDARGQAASAFARYPYPESFFAWRPETVGNRIWFLNRADRRPTWSAEDDGQNRFPVQVGRADTGVERALRSRIERDVRRGRTYSIFEMPIAGTPYQVVARLYYRDPYSEQLHGIVGFTVNLAWVRRHYFPAVASQLAAIVGRTPTPIAIVDDRGQVVAGRPALPSAATTLRASFAVMFFDPLLASTDPERSIPRGPWAVAVDVQPALAAMDTRAFRTLAVAAVSAGALVLGLILTARATRASARLAEMRSDFVSTVTHDLKTPIATIRAIGDTIVRGRLSDETSLRDYAEIIVQESKRLTRLVENLLAYARITDVTEVYAFEPLAVDALVDEVLQGFRAALAVARFEVHLDVPSALRRVRADRTAIRLALDNVIDNAIRYSGPSRWLSIAARPAGLGRGPGVLLLVQDRGVGIPADEIDLVTRRFFRGRGARLRGTGLGLAIASRIVGDHGGELAVESRPGEGTTVRIALPAAEQGDEETDPDR